VDWYETAHALVGGDDFGEFLPWAHELRRLVDQGRDPHDRRNNGDRAMTPSDKTLRKFVEHYIQNYRPKHLAEVEHLQKIRRIEVAILNAVKFDALNGRRHSHHWAISDDVRDAFHGRLQAIREELRAAVSFHALYSIIERVAGHGIGDLGVYDPAHRIGAYLGLSTTLIYLHRGTAEGACRLLGITGQRTIDLNDLPSVLTDFLTPAEIEDFLCIYKDALIGGKKTSRCFRVDPDANLGSLA
jgi:hypothetical protein